MCLRYLLKFLTSQIEQLAIVLLIHSFLISLIVTGIFDSATTIVTSNITTEAIMVVFRNSFFWPSSPVMQHCYAQAFYKYVLRNCLL